MNGYEILAVVVILTIFLTLFLTYFFHGRKLTKKEKSEKKKVDVKVEETKPSEPEQKPVPVGIIKEKKEEETLPEMAPFKETVMQEETKKEEKRNDQTLQDEIKGLSKDMKKVIMSDILKPRF